MLEYILVLVVIVGIVLGIVFQFNEAFKNFLTSYFGDYLSCLLETGEMPSLGGQGGTRGICDSEFQPFSLASGRPKVTLSSSQRGALNDSQRGALKASSGALRNQSFIAGNNVYNGEAAGRDTKSGRQLSQQTLPQNNNQAASGSASSSSEGTSGGAGISIRRGGRWGGRMLTQTDSAISEKNPSKDKKINAIIKRSQAEKDGEDVRPLRVFFDPEKIIKKRAETDVSMPMSFEGILKFLLIAAIIVVIVIFFGGQAMTIKKGWDKG